MRDVTKMPAMTVAQLCKAMYDQAHRQLMGAVLHPTALDYREREARKDLTPGDLPVRLDIPYDTQLMEYGAPVEMVSGGMDMEVVVRFAMSYDPDKDEGPIFIEDYESIIARLKEIRSLIHTRGGLDHDVHARLAWERDVIGKIDAIIEYPKA